MRINREAKGRAKKLFNACFENGQLSEEAVKKVVSLMLESKPRNYLGALKWFERLVSIELAKRDAHVETAVALGGDEATVATSLKKKFGEHIDLRFSVNEDLLGGARVRVGNDVWDASVRGRLRDVGKMIADEA